MFCYKIVIAYDGTDYQGWQQQENGVGVTQAFERVFFEVFKQKIRLVGASRTDSGVHALGQVARFYINDKLDPAMMLHALNMRLPASLFIRSLEFMPYGFHPMHHVDYKIYYYHIFLKRPLPHLARFGWYPKFIEFVDIEAFKKALNVFKGEHDFTSFARIEDPNKTSIRQINYIGVEDFPQYNALRVVIVGPSFLQYQIRRMVGYALDLSRRTKTPDIEIQKLLNNPSHHQILLRAASEGLCLRKIVYKKSLIQRLVVQQADFK